MPRRRGEAVFREYSGYGRATNGVLEGEVSELAGVDGRDELAEQRLSRPAGRRMDVVAASYLVDSNAKFEKTNAQGQSALLFLQNQITPRGQPSPSRRLLNGAYADAVFEQASERLTVLVPNLVPLADQDACGTRARIPATCRPSRSHLWRGDDVDFSRRDCTCLGCHGPYAILPPEMEPAAHSSPAEHRMNRC